MKRIWLIAAVAIVSALTGGLGHAEEPMTTVALRPIVEAAVSRANGDPDKAIAAMDQAVLARWGDVGREPIWLIPQTIREVSVNVMPPYARYRADIEGLLRKHEPVDQVEFANAVAIEIAPKEIDAPDFVQVIVERDGHEVAPVKTTLAERRFDTRNNWTTYLHAGIVSFPVTAFAPEGTVVISLVPYFGAARVTTLAPQQLMSLK